MENPLVAILASPGADSRATSRGFSSLAHLIAPFTTHTVNVRDPSTAQYTSNKISLDMRDIRKQGHLLSLSVLPHVLHEALCSKPSLEDSLTIFSECLKRFAEPVEQETLRSYLACIFIVSGGETNPMSELSQLIQAQHGQQHSSNESHGLSPAHCSPPKWTSPSTLKYYVLLHDALVDDEARSTEAFNQMCHTYGSDVCQLWKLGVGDASGLPDAWRSTDEMDRILERGLRRALQHVANAQIQQHNVLERKASAPTSVSTIATSYGMEKSSTSSSSIQSLNGMGLGERKERIASSADREACGKMVEKFLKEALMPHVERQLRVLYEQSTARRGIIGKSLTSGMKSWFGSRSGSTTTQASSPVTYSAESAEMQSRRLADLAFQFGLYSFAHSQYRAVKKEFENEQAWLHHAAALEMSAVALYLFSPDAGTKFPYHYLEDALKHMLKNKAKHTSVMRCALNMSRVYEDNGKHKEAATLLAGMAILDSDQCVGVAQTQAAICYDKSRMPRKAAFYRVLAGNRFVKAQLNSLANECYRVAFAEYYGKRWDAAEDHLCYLLAVDSSESKLAVDCATRLMRESELQSELKQTLYLNTFVATMNKFAAPDKQPVLLPLPLVDQDVRVVCGERPLSEDLAKQSGSTQWSDIERSAFHAIAGSSTAFRRNQLVSDSTSDNQRVKETPPGERFRLLFRLRNPLVVPLNMANLRLGVADVKMRDASTSSQAFINQEVIKTLTLEAEETREVELWLTPSPQLAEFRVDCLLMDVLSSGGELAVSGRLPLEMKARKTGKNPQKTIQDERLKATVAQRSWPLLDIRITKGWADEVYAGQAVRLVVEAENIGHESVTGLCLSTDAVDSVVAGTMDAKLMRIPAPNSIGASSTDVRVFNVLTEPIAVGSKIKLFVDVRAPQSLVVGHSVPLLFFYRGISGAFREWRIALSLTTRPLFYTAVRVLDDSHGLVAVSLRNEMEASEAALARIDVLRLRAVHQKADKKGCWSNVPSKLVLAAVRSRAVTLDCDQADTFCICMTGESSGAPTSVHIPTNEGTGDELWLCESHISNPQWPPPRPPLIENAPLIIDDRQIAVLWKASVVNNDGHVSTLVGENFLPDPFISNGLAIPGLEEIPDTVAIHSSPSRGPAVDGNEKMSMTNALLVLCEPVPSLHHDFVKNRLCEFPLRVSVKNQDVQKRRAHVKIKFAPKVREGVTSSSHLSPDSRQQWWVDRPAIAAIIESKEQHVFNFTIRVAQPSVYDVAGGLFHLEAQFDGDAEKNVYKVPNVLVVVNAIV